MGVHSRELQQAQSGKLSRARESSPCELCKQQASVYCPWDEANLCDLCDAEVHGANFLVARHSRHVLCPCCGVPALQSSHTGPRIKSHQLVQEMCMQCRLHTSVCQQDVDGPSSAESCCITAVSDDDQESSACAVLSSGSSSPQPTWGSIQEKRLRGSTVKHIQSSSAETTLDTQDEGLGDSEDASYGSSFPCKRRRISE